MTDQGKGLVRVEIQDLKAAAHGDKSALALVSQNPAAALALVSSPTAGLTVHQQSQVCESVLGSIANEEQARELIKNSLTNETAVEVFASCGSRTSVFDYLAPPSLIRDAILRELSSLDHSAGDYDDVFAALLIRAWAAKLCDRKDWQEILDLDFSDSAGTAAPVDQDGNPEAVNTGETFYDYLIAACWCEVTFLNFGAVEMDPDQEEEDEGKSSGHLAIERDDWRDFVANDFVRFNLEVTDASNRLEQMIARDSLPTINATGFTLVKNQLAAMRAEREDRFSPEAQAASAAKDLDI
jgi:hypothetical protein